MSTAKSIMRLRGVIKSERPVSVEEMKEAVRRRCVEDNERILNQGTSEVSEGGFWRGQDRRYG